MPRKAVFSSSEDEVMWKIIKKLEEHDQRFLKIDTKLEEHDQQLEIIVNSVNGLEGRFDNLESRFDNLEGRFIKLEIKVDKIEENMATKDDIRNITNTLDTIVGLVKKFDQELIFMGQRLSRVEAKIQ